MLSGGSKGSIRKNELISILTGTASASAPAFINTSHKISVHRCIPNEPCQRSFIELFKKLIMAFNSSLFLTKFHLKVRQSFGYASAVHSG